MPESETVRRILGVPIAPLDHNPSHHITNQPSPPPSSSYLYNRSNGSSINLANGSSEKISYRATLSFFQRAWVALESISRSGCNMQMDPRRRLQYSGLNPSHEAPSTRKNPQMRHHASKGLELPCRLTRGDCSCRQTEDQDLLESRAQERRARSAILTIATITGN